MKRCGKCGKFTYYNSHFGREICPYCGWIESVQNDKNSKVWTVKKNESGKLSLIHCK